MSNTADIHWQILDAKRAHRKWVGHALLLIEGASVQKEMVPVNETECVFGQWYFSNGQVLHDNDLFRQIGRYHEDLHQKYAQIYSLIFKEEQGLSGRLIGKTSKAGPAEIQLARKKYGELNTISHDLVKLLDELLIEIKETEASEIII